MRFWPFNVIADKVAEGRRRQEEIVRKEFEAIERINALPESEARRLAFAGLAADSPFTCELAIDGTALPGRMPNTLKEVFSRYRQILTESEGSQLDLDFWSVSVDLGEPFYVVGEFMEGVDLYCNCDTGEIGYCEFGETSVTHTFATVFHWLVYDTSIASGDED